MLKEIESTSHNVCLKVLETSFKSVRKSGVCDCHYSQLVTINVQAQNISGSLEICNRHGIVGENFGGASTSIPDLVRRCLSHKLFLELCADWMFQMDSVLVGEMFALDNEVYLEGNLESVKGRFRDILKLYERAVSDLGNAGKQPKG